MTLDYRFADSPLSRGSVRSIRNPGIRNPLDPPHGAEDSRFVEFPAPGETGKAPQLSADLDDGKRTKVQALEVE